MGKVKLLVLEGGGYFGLIGTTFLSFLGKDYDICDHIDSISGCSIGGIQVCALMNGCSAHEIQQGFITKGKNIFKRRSSNILNIPWYSDEGLKNAIYDFVGDNTIGDTKKIYPNTSMFVLAMNMTQNKLKVYDNIDGKDDNYKLLDVSLDTSAAMIYFPIRNHDGDAYVDGGIREVCPVMTHAIGLKKKLGISFQDMDVFVICAGDSIAKRFGTYEQISKWNIIDWMTKFIINDITISNQNTSKFWGQNIGFNSFEWFNPVRVTGSLDDIRQTDYILEQCEMYKELFLDKWEKFING